MDDGLSAKMRVEFTAWLSELWESIMLYDGVEVFVLPESCDMADET